MEEKKEEIIMREATPMGVPVMKQTEVSSSAQKPATGFLQKPSMIYAEPQQDQAAEQKPVQQELPNVEEQKEKQVSIQFVNDDEESFDMQLVEKNTSQVEESTKQKFQLPVNEEPPVYDEAQEQRKKAAERLQKLRNLSFNINNPADPNSEFENVPAYLRRNLELYNTISPAENFYSNYTVQADDNNKAEINTINTFLDGKKPD